MSCNKEKPSLTALINRSARLIGCEIDHALKEHGIARSQYRVLHFISRYGEPTQTELIEAMEIQASTLTLIVDVLVRKGWLVRIKDTGDRRSNKLRLTPEGEENFRQIPDPARKIRRIMVQTLSAEELQSLEVSLKKIINVLR
jgi:DNA-binding MarR family transcriptional regulator